MRKWILIFVGALALLVALAYGVGTRLPRDHVATVRAHFGVPPDSVYRTLADPGAYPSWRPGVEKVELQPERQGRQSWRERTSSGVLAYEFTVSVRPTRLVSTIVTPDAGFSGRWIYQILPDSAGTTVTITEEGSVDNPLFRTMMNYVFGKYSSLETLLRDLGKRFGETVQPTRLV